MSFNSDGYFDINESLRAIELEGGYADIMMGIVRPSVGKIEGEGRLGYDKTGTPRQIDVLGYFFDGCPPQGKDRQHYNSVTVIKHTDFATPSLFRLLNENCNDLEVSLTRYHASGESKRFGDAQPALEILLENADIRAISTFSSSRSLIPFDIVSFGFRQLIMTTRQQLGDGRMGPAHICRLYNHEGDTRRNERRKKL